jgi:hypothetical protein
MLEERDSDWPAMSSAALKAYDDFFCPEVCFHRVVELCVELKETGVTKSFPDGGVRNRAFLAAGVYVAHGRVTSSLRQIGSRVIRALGLRR